MRTGESVRVFFLHGSCAHANAVTGEPGRVPRVLVLAYVIDLIAAMFVE